ncbi:SDR family oxidoreductase [Mangrovibacterium diazotrophicum]|uniref:NAD(P)H dehydrogenase (Quinone) n=1 Tax=Mangrovibacterium diazotrophicum TaxID=1261403 RepID=A0A419VV26_9BACT|nr:SDR family oxidoreductase [Mangrovibacterium diazotrophicum]RKD85985.1 NAD(P)H dehydrogenase (quinone) [Mangrovibacterium diazotrophicum]
MKIGITGATGQLGQLVVEQLKKRVSSEEIVALVRTPEKAAGLGVEAREFDYMKPESLVKSLSGIDKLLLISGNEVGKREEQHKNVIAAAKEAGVKWIVYTSLLHADKSSLSLAGEHVATEEALKASGIAFTILRNGWYTENYTGSIAGALAGGAFIGSAGDGKISSAARADFAEAAAVVVSGEGHEGKVYELAGDESYTLKDLAAEISSQAGKDIPYNNLPEETYAEILKSFGLPDFLAAAIASWDTGASKNDLFDGEKQLSKLIGRPTTPLADVVAKAL